MAAQGPHPSQALCASSLGGFQKGSDVKTRDVNPCEKPLARDDERHMMNIPFQAGELHCKHMEEGKPGRFEFLGSFLQKYAALGHAGAAMSNSEPLWPGALPQQCRSPWSHQGLGPALFFLLHGIRLSLLPRLQKWGLSNRSHLMSGASHCPLRSPGPKQPWCSPKDLILSPSSLVLVPHRHQNNHGWICPESPWGPKIPISQSQMFLAAFPAGCAMPRAPW